MTVDYCTDAGKCNAKCLHGVKAVKLLVILAPDTVVDGNLFSVKIKDSEGNLIDGATVVYNDQEKISDSIGECLFQAKKDASKITAAKNGYESAVKSIVSRGRIEIRVLDPDKISFAVSVGDRDKIEIRPGETTDVRVFVRNAHTTSIHNLRVNADNPDIIKSIEPKIMDELKPNEIKSFVAKIGIPKDAKLGSIKVNFEVEADEFTRSRVVPTTIVVSSPSDFMIFVYIIIIVAIVFGIAFKIYLSSKKKSTPTFSPSKTDSPSQAEPAAPIESTETNVIGKIKIAGPSFSEGENKAINELVEFFAPLKSKYSNEDIKRVLIEKGISNKIIDEVLRRLE